VHAKRVRFAREWANKSAAVIKRVCFSDEHQLNTNDFTCRTMWVWDKSEVLFRERKRDQNCVRVHVWAAVGVGYKSNLVMFPQWKLCKGRRGMVKTPFRVTAVEYTERCLRPLDAQGDIRRRLFLQDNARIHTANHTIEALKGMNWTLVERFPPYSPDLNPIELMWAVFNRRVAELRPATLEELTGCAQRVWDEFDQSEVDHFCASWLKSLQRCCSRGGKP
jgi:hypothetical protein